MLLWKPSLKILKDIRTGLRHYLWPIAREHKLLQEVNLQNMAQTVKLALLSLAGILGWHGAFLVLLIVSFKLFLEQNFIGQEGYTCPCTWPTGYGIIMFLFPSLSTFLVAFFAYFRRDNDSVPWKAVKKLYELKCACNFYDGRTDWDSHAEHCIRCRVRWRDWNLVKVALSAIFSLLYPLMWLSLSFLQKFYYVCAHVGPDYDTLTRYCDITEIPDNYQKNIVLAAIRSKVIGGVLFVSALLLLGVFVIVYGEIKTYLKKKDDSSRCGPNGRADNLQVHVSVLPSRSSGTSDSAGLHGNRESPFSAVESGGQVTNQNQPQLHDGNKTIRINLSDEFTTALQGCLQESKWQGIDICCSQKEEGTSRQGSNIQFPERSLHQRISSADRTLENPSSTPP